MEQATTGHVKCPICNASGALSNHDSLNDVYRLTCATCGEHRFTSVALTIAQFDRGKQAQLAHGVRKLPVGAFVDDTLLVSIRDKTRLPDALERIDNVLLYLAREHEPGKSVTLSPLRMTAVVGSTNEEAASWAITQAIRQGLITWGIPESMQRTVSEHMAGGNTPFMSFERVQLSADGWRRYAALVGSGVGSRHAFMAMKFGDAQLDAVYQDHLKPAVARAGFDLRATNDAHQAAGNIDDRMRVEIRTSRFMVCDLIHGNRGAYWEAGFAEGIGRPVFFTCRQDVLSAHDPESRPHFDTDHQLIIPWDPSDLETGMEKLTNAIRATLPAEAKLQD
jgi:ribosomal protein S27AE